MTYQEFINSIKESRPLNEWFEYSERHHIIPRCLGGTDDEENLIYLTLKEHFIAHKLLAEENPDNSKLIKAYWMMCNHSKVCSPEDYEEGRRNFINSIKGSNNPFSRPEVKEKLKEYQHGMKGKKHSEETKLKMSESHKNMSDETRLRMCIAARNRPPVSDETREKLRNVKHTEDWNRKVSSSLKGKPKSDEHRKNLSISARNRVYSEEGYKSIKSPKSEEHKRKLSEIHKRKTYIRVCKVCGKEFIARTCAAKYCSDKCRSTVYW